MAETHSSTLMTSGDSAAAAAAVLDDEDDEESKSLTVQHMPASFNIAIIDQQKNIHVYIYI